MAKKTNKDPAPEQVQQPAPEATTTPEATAAPELEQTPAFPMMVQVTTDRLEVRKGPGRGHQVTGRLCIGAFTVSEESDGWGSLENGLGWIDLRFTQRP